MGEKLRYIIKINLFSSSYSKREKFLVQNLVLIKKNQFNELIQVKFLSWWSAYFFFVRSVSKNYSFRDSSNGSRHKKVNTFFFIVIEHMLIFMLCLFLFPIHIFNDTTTEVAARDRIEKIKTNVLRYVVGPLFITLSFFTTIQCIMMCTHIMICLLSQIFYHSFYFKLLFIN